MTERQKRRRLVRVFRRAARRWQQHCAREFDRWRERLEQLERAFERGSLDPSFNAPRVRRIVDDGVIAFDDMRSRATGADRFGDRDELRADWRRLRVLLRALEGVDPLEQRELQRLLVKVATREASDGR